MTHPPETGHRRTLSHHPSSEPGTGRSGRSGRSDQSGQATAEYALVLLGAAAVALMLAAWAARSGAIGDLFDAVVGQLISRAR